MGLADRFLKPTETLLEPGSIVQYEGVHCIPDGSWVPSWDLTIRLSLMPWLLNLVLPFAFNNSGAERWQCDWLCCFDCSFTIRLCLYKFSCMGGTTHHFPGL